MSRLIDAVRRLLGRRNRKPARVTTLIAMPGKATVSIVHGEMTMAEYAAWRCRAENANWPPEEHCLLPPGSCDTCRAEARAWALENAARVVHGGEAC